MARKEKDFNYFEAFTRMIDIACDAAVMLNKILVEYDPATIHDRMDEMHEIEHAGDQENHILIDKLAKEFVTPIEREDIINIAHMLDEITDSIDSTTQRLYMFSIQEVYAPSIEFSNIIIKCCNALRDALAEFEQFKKSKTINDLIVKVGDFEEEADQLYIEAQHELFAADYDPKYVNAWSRTLARMEACCDACEYVGNTIRTAIMKNS